MPGNVSLLLVTPYIPHPLPLTLLISIELCSSSLQAIIFLKIQPNLDLYLDHIFLLPNDAPSLNFVVTVTPQYLQAFKAEKEEAA